MTRPCCLFVLVWAGVVLAGGCGSETGPQRKLVPVAGKVSFNGKPLTQGTISFVAAASDGISAAGEIDAAGRYQLSTHKPQDGAAPGAYKVRIESWVSPPRMDEKGTDPGKPAIPEKYFDVQKSGLTAEVKDESKPPEINFDLTP